MTKRKLNPEAAARRAEAELARRHTEERLKYYRPYPKQREFHDAGANNRERLLMAANQVGKTLASGFEIAMHMTGLYPADWRGVRFDRPTAGWICGRSDEDVRDGLQRILLGRPGAIGTGTIPKKAIGELVTARGIADLYDSIRVHHASGGISTAATKSYKAGREAFQGETLDWIAFDEEPPADVYFEGLTRTNISNGPVWLTFTPLFGMSEVVKRFLLEKQKGRHVTTMTIEDAEHYTKEQRAAIIASYPQHERDARTMGIPILGSGRIFPVSEELIACNARNIPDHWARIGGLDFGWDHPFAAVELVHDRDTDTVYVTRCYRIREATPVMHAAALRPWGEDLPWSWPRDGRNETLAGAGVALAEQYETEGLQMIGTHAQFDDKGVSVEAGLMMMLDRMQSGRFKVFRHLNDWFEEFRLYHRKDGKVVKIADDLMSATRYALMMLRYAEVRKELPRNFNSYGRYAGRSWQSM